MLKMFSVIIPTYNRAHTIVDTLNSVVEQSYRPIEIIVVDDGSTDDTENVVKAWELSKGLSDKGDIFLSYSRQDNAGAAAARNRGIREISPKSKYVQFLDSDDRLHSQRFAVLEKAFKQEDADFIQTTIEWIIPSTGEVIGKLQARPLADQVELVLNGDFWANTLRAAFRRDLIDQIGFWENQMTCFDDREFIERAVLQANKPIAIQPVLGYLDRSDGERITNRNRTREGRYWRIYSERKLVEQVLKRGGTSDRMKAILASRIYRVGCRSAARGWYDYARECADIGDLLQVPVSWRAKSKRLLCRMGVIGGILYRILTTIKFACSGKIKPPY